MKVALVHDYLTQQGGAERVFELLCKQYPEADIYTSLYDPQHTIDLGDRPVHTSVLQKFRVPPDISDCSLHSISRYFDRWT